jgi:type I restriction enzyme S subunit
MKNLGDVCQVVGGGTPSISIARYYEGQIPWATVRDLRSDIVTETERSITEEAVRNSAANIIPSGNVVIATRVGLGKVCIIKQDTAINQDLRGIIPNDPTKISTRFLYYWFKRVAHLIVGEGTGATVQGVKVPFIKALQLPIPPFSEQQRIVTILNIAFEGIDTAKANAEKNLQNAYEVFESERESKLSGNKSGWRSAPLSELCSIKHGFAFQGEHFRSEGRYVLLTPGNFIEAGGYRDRGEKQKYYIGEVPDGFILSKGDLLIAMTEQAAGLLGSPILVPASDRFLHNQRLGLVNGNPGVPWCNEFFFHVFNTKGLRAAVHASGSGVKVRHTSPSKIGDVIVSYPTKVATQLEIAEAIQALQDECDKLASNYSQKLEALDELKQSLLHRAFNGDL